MQKRSTSFYLTESTHRLIAELAEAQGTSKNRVVENAVRLLNEDPTDQPKPDLIDAKDETILELRDQIHFLRRELERKDTILMAMTQRIPELEPAQDTESPETASEPPTQPETPATDPETQTATERPWWRRWLD